MYEILIDLKCSEQVANHGQCVRLCNFMRFFHEHYFLSTRQYTGIVKQNLSFVFNINKYLLLLSKLSAPLKWVGPIESKPTF